MSARACPREPVSWSLSARACPREPVCESLSARACPRELVNESFSARAPVSESQCAYLRVLFCSLMLFWFFFYSFSGVFFCIILDAWLVGWLARPPAGRKKTPKSKKRNSKTIIFQGSQYPRALAVAREHQRKQIPKRGRKNILEKHGKNTKKERKKTPKPK